MALQKEHYIDKTVLSIIERVDDEVKKIKLYEDYLDRIQMLQIALMETYLEEKGVAGERINGYVTFANGQLEKLTEITGDAVEGEADDVDYSKLTGIIDAGREYSDISELLASPEYQDRLEQEIDNYNETYYQKARNELSQEEKDKLNNYLVSIDEQRKYDFAEFVDEIAGQIKEDKEGGSASPPQSNDQTQSPQIKSNDEVQSQSTQTVQPDEQVKSTESAVTDQPATATQSPGKGQQSATPTGSPEAGQSVETSQPTTLIQPPVSQPTTPTQPQVNQPNQPGQPGQPGQPDQPGQPGQPNQPSQPGQSKQSEHTVGQADQSVTQNQQEPQDQSSSQTPSFSSSKEQSIKSESNSSTRKVKVKPIDQYP